jgi:hypothetical protein
MRAIKALLKLPLQQEDILRSRQFFATVHHSSCTYATDGINRDEHILNNIDL